MYKNNRLGVFRTITCNLILTEVNHVQPYAASSDPPPAVTGPPPLHLGQQSTTQRTPLSKTPMVSLMFKPLKPWQNSSIGCFRLSESSTKTHSRHLPRHHIVNFVSSDRSCSRLLFEAVTISMQLAWTIADPNVPLIVATGVDDLRA
jgi:hypothetical protein